MNDICAYRGLIGHVSTFEQYLQHPHMNPSILLGFRGLDEAKREKCTVGNMCYKAH